MNPDAPATRPGPRLLAAVTVAFAAVAALGVAPHAARGLIRTTRVPRCDLLVVLGGGAFERVMSGADLMDDGVCDQLMFTGDGFSDVLRARNGPDGHLVGRLIEAPAVSHSTLEDALITLRVARERRFESILVLTSPYHTRRASWVFSAVFARTGIRVGVLASDNFYMDYGRWWLSDDGRDAVFHEYTKLWACGLLCAAESIFVSLLLS